MEKKTKKNKTRSHYSIVKNFYQIKHKQNLWSAHKKSYMMCLNLDESVCVRSLLIILQSSEKSIQGRREKCFRASETCNHTQAHKKDCKVFQAQAARVPQPVCKVKREGVKRIPLSSAATEDGNRL